MPGQWYFARDGKKQGPVNLEQLRGMATAGQLNQKDMVLEDGTGKWTQAGSVRGLFEMPQAAAPAPAPAPAAAALADVQPVVPLPQPVPAPASWYYAKNGQQCGPVEELQLVDLYNSGQLQPTDLAWQAGTADWIPLGQAFPFAAGGALAARPTADQWLARRIGAKSPIAQSIVLGIVPAAISLIWLMVTPSRLFLGWFVLSALLFMGAGLAGVIGGAIQSSKNRPIWPGVRLGLFWYDAVVAVLFILWVVLSVVCGMSFVVFQR
jgi:GYF domain 2